MCWTALNSNLPFSSPCLGQPAHQPKGKKKGWSKRNNIWWDLTNFIFMRLIYTTRTFLCTLYSEIQNQLWNNANTIINTGILLHNFLYLIRNYLSVELLSRYKTALSRRLSFIKVTSLNNGIMVFWPYKKVMDYWVVRQVNHFRNYVR